MHILGRNDNAINALDVNCGRANNRGAIDNTTKNYRVALPTEALDML